MSSKDGQKTAADARRPDDAETAACAPSEIRDELSLVVGSSVFRDSPRLAAFLQFVVSAQLEGKSDRIKGYTIAVEALGRGPDFDPQNDPIVRVEARRLRDALTRYYSGEGRGDPVVIELPRGSYVPLFHRRSSLPGASATAVRQGRWAAAAAWTRDHARIFKLAFAAVGALSILEVLFDIDQPLTGGPNTGLFFLLLPEGKPVASSRRGVVTPIIYVEPLVATGAPTATSTSATMFRARLVDALARFDDATISTALPQDDTSALAPDYRVSFAANYNADASVSISIQLTDTSNGTIVWSKTYEGVPDPVRGLTEGRVIADVSILLMQPFGVIQAHERIARASHNNMDDPYRCLLDTFSYLRTFEVALFMQARTCLQRATETSPAWVSGFSLLGRLYLRQYQLGIVGPPGDAEVLDAALKTVQRAIEVKPASAVAQFMLQDVLLAGGDIPGARAAGEKSVRFNPNDRSVVFGYAFMLIMLGEVDEGVTLIKKVMTDNPIVPARYYFVMGLVAYLKGDLAAATEQASRITNDRYPPALMLRFLVAAKNGDHEQARKTVERLYAANPSWREDFRAAIGRFLPKTAPTERIVADFEMAAAALTH